MQSSQVCLQTLLKLPETLPVDAAAPPVRLDLVPGGPQVLRLRPLVHQRVDLPLPVRVEPVRQSPRALPEGFFRGAGTGPWHHRTRWPSVPPLTPSRTAFPGPLARLSERSPGFLAHASGTVPSSDFSPTPGGPFAFRLIGAPSLPLPPGQAADEISRGHVVFFRSVPSAHTLVRGVDGKRLRRHSADSTLPPLWPTGSSSGQPPSITARSFSASPSDSTSRWTPCPPKLISGGFRSALAVSVAFVPV